MGKVKEKVIPIDIYRRGVVLLQGEVEDVLKWFVKHHYYHFASVVNETDWEQTLAVTLCDNSDVIIYSVKPMDLPTLCHELIHTTFKILKIVGISADEEEAFAYLYEFLFRRVIFSSDVFPLQLSSGEI